MDPSGRDLPDLPLDAWEPTKDTLHLYCQVIGKIRLASTVTLNHWWNVTLYVSARGLTTGRMHYRGRRFELELDFTDHRVALRTEDGAHDHFALRDGLSVAEFYGETMAMLARAGIEPEIPHPVPFGVPMTTPFAEDTEHAAYDAARVHDVWRALLWVDDVLAEHAGGFTGKQSPTHVFWHSFDIAQARFSGRRAPGADVDHVTQEAYSHEVISQGWWAGSVDLRAPAFYAYAAPEPAGLAEAPLRPDGVARWTEAGSGHLAILPYDDARAAPDPRAAVLDFFASVYEAGARRAGWPAELLRDG